MLSRSWLLLCERLYEEGASKNKKAAAGSVVPGTGDAGPDTAPPASAPSAAEVNPFVSKWKSIRTKTSVATMLSRAARKEQAPKPTKIIGGTEYPMWSKLAGGEDTPEYIEGRDLVGAAFVEIFASQNAWAVKDFNYGLNPEHAKKMGLALELIVSGATKPQKLQQKLRVLGLGHVQMGIKPEMFPSFEKALFTFLQQVGPAHGIPGALFTLQDFAPIGRRLIFVPSS